jgi:hypothetical protein
MMRQLLQSPLSMAMILLMIFSASGCAGQAHTPAYPKMTDAQKQELRAVCNNDEDPSVFDPECRHLESWFDRIRILGKQLSE